MDDLNTEDDLDTGHKTKSKCPGFSSVANRSLITGRNSTANQATGELLAVPVSSSEKEAIEQAADWRDVRPRSLINLGLEKVAGAGGPIPAPTMYEELLDLSAKIQGVSKGPQDCCPLVELRLFRLDLVTSAQEVHAQHHKRKRLWEKAIGETSTRAIWAHLDGEELARLREKSKESGMSSEALLRHGLLHALNRQSEMKELESWIGRWAERARCLNERGASDGDPSPWIWEKVAEIGEEIDRVVRGSLPR